MEKPRVRPQIWIGLVAVAAYVVFAAVLGNILGALAGPADPMQEFALSHLIPLPIVILLGLGLVHWAGWSRPVWGEQPTPAMMPRRLWLLSIPVLSILVPLGQLFTIPWADRALGSILIVAVGTLLVGLGEELYLRGILLVTVREKHGELVTLLTTAFVFALAHIVGSLWHAVPPAVIAFQVGALFMTGVAYYWVRRVSGRLWVAVLVHAFTDFVLYVASGAGNPSDALATPAEPGNPVTVVAQILLIVAVAVSIVSVVREDLRTRRADRRGAGTAS